MIPGIDDLLSDLQLALTDVFQALAEGETTSARETRVRSLGDGLKITTDVRVRVGLLEALGTESRNPPPVVHEPLVEFFDKGANPRIIISLPGIKKEDVEVTFGEGVLDLEIYKGTRRYQRTIRCPYPPSEIKVRSVVENNSVVEVSFARRKPRAGRDRP